MSSSESWRNIKMSRTSLCSQRLRKLPGETESFVGKDRNRDHDLTKRFLLGFFFCVCFSDDLLTFTYCVMCSNQAFLISYSVSRRLPQSHVLWLISLTTEVKWFVASPSHKSAKHSGHVLEHVRNSHSEEENITFPQWWEIKWCSRGGLSSAPPRTPPTSSIWMAALLLWSPPQNGNSYHGNIQYSHHRSPPPPRPLLWSPLWTSRSLGSARWSGVPEETGLNV